MLYLNQLDYEELPYPTDVEHPDSEFAVHGNVRRAGCGLCAVCMVVDRLCLSPFSLEECRDLAVSAGANREIGTDMKILAPAAAERFGLTLRMTDDTEELAQCLRSGGAAVINTGGDRDGYIGTFSSGGHYITAISEDRGEFCLLDPSWTEDKYQSEPRRGRVRQQGKLLYAPAEVLRQDTANRSPAYYLFCRKDDIQSRT